MRERVQCIIIKDKKILLVKDNAADHYYPPGGGIEPGEDHVSAAERELLEELGIRLTSARYFFSYDDFNIVKNEPQRIHNYFTTYFGEPKPSAEIVDMKWLDWDSIATVPTPASLRPEFLDRLKSAGYL